MLIFEKNASYIILHFLPDDTKKHDDAYMITFFLRAFSYPKNTRTIVLPLLFFSNVICLASMMIQIHFSKNTTSQKSIA